MASGYTNEGSVFVAGLVRTGLAAGHVHLYKSGFTPDANSAEADFELNECDYDGYTAGGIAVATWLAAILAPGGGAGIQSGDVQFTYVDGVGHVGNSVGGWWYESAGSKAVVYGSFADPIPMQMNGQGIPLDLRLVFGA